MHLPVVARRPTRRSYEVWRNTVNDTASATRLAQNVRWAMYEDRTAVGGQGYYYWIKAVNPVPGPSASSSASR